jgi:hypothetical protein
MAQHTGDNGMNECAVRRRQSLRGGVECELQRLATPQDRVKQAQCCASRREAGRLIASGAAAGWMDGFGHGAP